MGKTKTAIIDDSQTLEAPETKVKKLKIKLEKPLVIKKPVVKLTDEALAPTSKETKFVSKAPQAKEKPRSKRYKEAAQLVNKDEKYSVKEAVELAQKSNYFKKSNATLELHLNTNTKNIRGLISLPFTAGRKLTILAFGKGAKEAGADIEGADETITEIEKGKINFDVLVVTPDWMPKLARVAKVLGPRGLMPNPKNDTITTNLAKTIAELQAGKTEYKTESSGQVIHLAIGKVDQPAEEIVSNIKVLYNTIGKSKITKMTLAATMGPGVKVNLSSI